MKLTSSVERETRYSPVWNGNQECDEPCVFVLRALTTGERADTIKMDIGGDGSAVVRPDFRRMFTLAVTGIENLSLDGTQIDTAAKLLAAPGLHELYVEVSAHIAQLNARPSVKN